mgnify:CR=1 FL=1
MLKNISVKNTKTVVLKHLSVKKYKKLCILLRNFSVKKVLFKKSCSNVLIFMIFSYQFCFLRFSFMFPIFIEIWYFCFFGQNMQKIVITFICIKNTRKKIRLLR